MPVIGNGYLSSKYVERKQDAVMGSPAGMTSLSGPPSFVSNSNLIHPHFPLVRVDSTLIVFTLHSPPLQTWLPCRYSTIHTRPISPPLVPH